MGELMRRYWHPIAAAQELEDSPFRTKEVTILGEDLVLYKDRSGHYGLIERYCSHRRVNLAIGVVEEDGLRCQYHGWKFDNTGKCVEQPFEDTMHPEAAFRAKCNLSGYPVQEKAGLLFAYMGPQPAPLFPMWEPYTWTEVVRDIAIVELPCNWMQCQENSLDPVHNEWLHAYYSNHVASVMGLPNSRRQSRSNRKHVKIGFDEFEYGIIKRRVQEGGSENDDDWRMGHPVMFPNILLVGSQFSATMQFRVPIDDTRTYHVSLYTFNAAPGAKPPAQARIPYRIVPLHDQQGNWVLNYVFNQDYMAWETQGEIAKRELEKLGESDRGIILFRRMLREHINKLQAGETPMNVFHQPGRTITDPIHLPLEPVKFGQAKVPPYRPGEAGESADADLIRATLATWEAQAAPAAPEPEKVGLF